MKENSVETVGLHFLNQLGYEILPQAALLYANKLPKVILIEKLKKHNLHIPLPLIEETITKLKHLPYP